MSQPAPEPAPAPAPKPASRFSKALRRVVSALASSEARGPELALARIILAALGVKLGVNLVDYLK